MTVHIIEGPRPPLSPEAQREHRHQWVAVQEHLDPTPRALCPACGARGIRTRAQEDQ